MYRMIAGLALATAMFAPTVCKAATMRFECSAPGAGSGQSPDHSGVRDRVMGVGGNPIFGILSLGRSGAELAGSIALNAGVVVVRSLKLTGEAVAMAGASRDGDVRLDGLPAPNGRICGIVSHHRD